MIVALVVNVTNTPSAKRAVIDGSGSTDRQNLPGGKGITCGMTAIPTKTYKITFCVQRLRWQKIHHIGEMYIATTIGQRIYAEKVFTLTIIMRVYQIFKQCYRLAILKHFPQIQIQNSKKKLKKKT